jgi:ATP-dependent Clp protease ATP-binding subunit ClpX
MILKESILYREAEFKKRYGIVFREGRIDLIVNRIIEKGYDVNTVFEEAEGIQRQVEEFEMDFKRRNGIYLQFNEEAIDRITEILLNEDGKGTALFSRLSKDYEYGFELIRDKTGQKEFIITREAVDNPEGYLDRTIREICKRQTDQRLEGKE